MKRVLAVLFAVMIVGQAWAYDFKSGDLYYNITSNNTVEVTEGNYSNLTIINIPKTVIFNNITYSVTSIGIAAFSDCSGLTSVNIPNSVTSIESGAFYDCNELSSVSIGSSVTSIGEDAFFGCNNLKFNTYDNAHYLGNVENPYVVLFEARNKNITSCVITNNCRVINDMAFYDCQLAQISIPNSVVSIGRYAFGYCKLTSVTIPNSVTSIGEFAFSGCADLGKANFATINSLCNIQFGNEDSNPLSYAKDLYINEQKQTNLVIPNTITHIGGYVFNNCHSLTSVTIGNSVINIGKSAFAKCKNLNAITIPNSVTSIGEGAFDGCSNLKTVSIPNTISEINDKTFHWCSNLESIIIPNSVTKIGNEAFLGCKLQTLNIPNSIIEIGEYAFAYCGLKTLDIPSSVKKIGDYAFISCHNLTQVKISASVKIIGKEAFSDCPNLNNVYFQAGTKPVGWDAKWEHQDKTATSNQDKSTTANKEKSSSPNNYTGQTSSDGAQRYYDFSAVCSSGQTLYYKYTFNPNTVRLCLPMWYPDYVGEYKTYGSCKRPTGNLIIPETVTFEGKTYIVTEICDGVFYNCEGLTSVTIPNSINKIGSSVFRGCSNLTSVTIKSEAYIGNADIYLKKGKLWYCVLDKSTISVVSDGIQNYAGDIVIPAKISAGNTFSVVGISPLAFAECIDLKTVAIPSSIKTIGRDAFRSCIHLTAIYCQEKSEPYGWDNNWNPNKYKVVWGAIDKFK